MLNLPPADTVVDAATLARLAQADVQNQTRQQAQQLANPQAPVFADGALTLDHAGASFADLAGAAQVPTNDAALTGVPASPVSAPNDTTLAAGAVAMGAPAGGIVPGVAEGARAIGCGLLAELALAETLPPVALNLALTSSIGGEEITAIDDNKRFVRRSDDVLGRLELRDANGAGGSRTKAKASRCTTC